MSLTDNYWRPIAFTVINKYGKGAAVEISTMFGPVYHVAFRKIPWNRNFSTLTYPGFSESIASEIHNVSGVSFFFWKCSKFKSEFKNAAKKWEKVFCFRDNCIWIGCIKFCLLRREYLPSALNVLQNSVEILHVTNTDFLQVNCVHSDQ